MKSKKTMVLGASENTERYSNKAVRLLVAHHHEVIAIGNREGFIEDTPILKNIPQLSDIDTITLYMNPSLQELFKDVIIAANPKRIIFNPGTENPALEQLAAAHNITCLHACTLVMLSTGQY
jgi:predicted CoA-binding protein